MRIRQRLTALEAAGLDIRRLGGLAGELSALRDAEQRIAARLAAEACEIRPWGGMRIDPDALNAAAPVIRHAVLEAAVLAVSGRESLPAGARSAGCLRLWLREVAQRRAA